MLRYKEEVKKLASMPIKKIKFIAIATIPIITLFISVPVSSKTIENFIYHLRERHDINFMSPYQFVTAFRYLHRNDPAFVKKYSNSKNITIDDLVQFVHLKAKGVCFNQQQMTTYDGRNQVFDYIEDIANMKDINDYWITSKDRRGVPPNVLQITGKRGGYKAIGVRLNKNDDYGLETAFPDGYPDGNGSGVGTGMTINQVRQYYLNNILISESKLKEEFNKSLEYVESSLPSEFENMINNYNIESSALRNKQPKLLPTLHKSNLKRIP